MKKHFIIVVSLLLATFLTEAQIINTIAGNGTTGYSGDGGPATAAEFHDLWSVTTDGFGNLFIADHSNHVIRKINTAGIITTVAGNGMAGYSGDGGTATSAQLYQPGGMAVDASGNLYIADSYNNVIRKVNTGGVITTIAGNGNGAGVGFGGYSGDGGPATAAELYGPSDVKVDASGNIYIADWYHNIIRKVTITGFISTIAGTGYTTTGGMGGYTGDGGPATAADLSGLQGIALDNSSGNLYIGDYNNNVVRKIHLASGIITTVAGNGTAGYSGDGAAATAAMLNVPMGIAIDGSGNFYITDAGNHVIRKISTTGIISTIAGNGTSGYSGDGGLATAAQLATPFGASFDGTGNLYIADNNNNRIRKISSITVPITGTTYVCAGSTTTLSNASPGGIWNSSNTAIATVGPVTGVVAGISAGTAIITYTGGLVFGTASVTVNPLPSPVITAAGPVLSTTTYITYQWLLGGMPISGATNQNYTAVANGTYSVTVTDNNGCAATSAGQAVSGLAVNNVNGVGYIKVYPNPASMTLTIDASETISVYITGMDGRTLIGQKDARDISISKLSPGLYMARIYNREGALIKTVKFTKE